MVGHFLSLLDLSRSELRGLIVRAAEMKAGDGGAHGGGGIMAGKTAALVFEKSSTRTRVSFEAGVYQLGGRVIFLAPGDSHLGRGEPIADTARVLSQMVDVIIMRTGAHSRLEEMAAAAEVPVINALSDFNHPCQLLADVLTFNECRGDIRGAQVAWVGDGNNVCHSWMNAARQFEFELKIATPKKYAPDAALAESGKDFISFASSPTAAVQAADLVVTDCWISMGQEHQSRAREKDFANFCVDEKLMRLAKPDALFMHCLPAYRGVEVAAAVIDGKQSVVWQQAGNRLHAQKALLEFLVGRANK